MAAKAGQTRPDRGAGKAWTVERPRRRYISHMRKAGNNSGSASDTEGPREAALEASGDSDADFWGWINDAAERADQPKRQDNAPTARPHEPEHTPDAGAAPRSASRGQPDTAPEAEQPPTTGQALRQPRRRRATLPLWQISTVVLVTVVATLAITGPSNPWAVLLDNLSAWEIPAQQNTASQAAGSVAAPVGEVGTNTDTSAPGLPPPPVTLLALADGRAIVADQHGALHEVRLGDALKPCGRIEQINLVTQTLSTQKCGVLDRNYHGARAQQ